MFKNRNLVTLLSEILGLPKRFDHGITEVEFNCIHCDKHRNKYNLVVNTDKQLFHCWACGYAGPVVRIINEHGTLNHKSIYKPNNKIIIEDKNIQLSDDELLSFSSFKSMRFEWNDNLHYIAAKYYINSRGIDDKIIDKWDICFADSGKYKNRIIIPSKNLDGKVEYFVARDFYGQDKYKYRNPPISKSNIIFGEKFIDWKKPVFLTEGVFDSLILYNAVPILGLFIDKHKKLINKIFENKTQIILAFDEDSAGMVDRIKVAKFLRKLGVSVFVMKNFGYKDISKAYEKEGKNYIINLIRSSVVFDELDLAMATL